MTLGQSRTLNNKLMDPARQQFSLKREAADRSFPEPSKCFVSLESDKRIKWRREEELGRGGTMNSSRTGVGGQVLR